MARVELTAGRLPALTRAEVDLGALAHNIRQLQGVAAPESVMMAVVKADGYGHGAVEVARVALDNGVRFLAVARINEAAHLRRAGMEAPLLIFGGSLPQHVPFLIRHDISVAVNSLDGAEQLAAAARRVPGTLRVHIKIDTGMGRLGIPANALINPGNGLPPSDRAVAAIRSLAALPGLTVEGIFTHFANADCRDKDHARGQFALFQRLLERVAAEGLQIPWRHAANSAALLEMPESHLDLVRPGIALYGLWPSAEMEHCCVDLKPVMSLKSTVIQVKDVAAGFSVSYGSTYTTPEPTRIATVPIGYADGFSRLLSNQGQMLVRGRRAPILGRVCMDLTLIDVGQIPGVQVGDEVLVMGRQGNEEISADEIARQLDTINYEVTASLTARVPRVYLS